MALSLTGDIDLKVPWTYEETNGFDGDDAPLQYNKTFQYLKKFETSGVASGQVNRLFPYRRTVTSSTTTDDLDLAGGITDRFGNTITFSSIKLLLIVNLSTNPLDNLLIGGAGAVNNAWGHPWNGDQDAQSRCYADSPWFFAARLNGAPVVGGSTDTLRIEHDGVSEAISFDIIIKGVQG